MPIYRHLHDTIKGVIKMKKSVFKKFVTCTLSAILAASSFPATAGIAANTADSAAAVSDVSVKSAKAQIRGDIDGNGKINVFDLIQMRKIFVDLTADNSAISGADIDGNGKIAINDLVMLAGYVVGKFSSFSDGYATTTTATTTKPVTTTTTTTTQEEIDVPNDLYKPVDGIDSYFVTDYKDGYEIEVYNTDCNKGSFFENHSGSDFSLLHWSDVENLRSTIRKKVPKQAPPISRISSSTASFSYYGDAHGDCFVGLHGWMQGNLCEYYIIDYYNGELPVGDAEFVNTVDIGGIKYDVYKGMKQDAPSIEGVRTFPVYYSVRSEQEHKYDTVDSSFYCNVISHFRHWEASGLELGERLYDVSIIADCGNGSNGLLQFSYVNIDVPTVDANPEYNLDFVYENDANNTPDENGYFINEGFENGVGGFLSTTNGFGKTTTTESFSGNKSFMVENYNKTSAYAYLPINCVNGEKRGINLMAMQNGVVSDTFTLVLSYDLEGDIPCMSHTLLLDSVEAPKGEWVKLSCPEFEFPENATSAKLKISSEISDNSFYIDDVKLSQAVEIKPDENGYFINEDFEKGDGGFKTITNNIAEICSTESFSGNNSFKVTDLFYSGAYACKKLECVPGEKRAVKLMVMQDEIETDTIILRLAYKPADEYDMRYIELGSVEAPKGEWVKLSCPEFEIPENTAFVKLYISASESLYIDDVTVSAVE